MPLESLANLSSSTNDTLMDSQAEINQPISTKVYLPTTAPSAKESRDRAASDAALSAMMGAKHGHNEAPSPGQA